MAGSDGDEGAERVGDNIAALPVARHRPLACPHHRSAIARRKAGLPHIPRRATQG
jgi:hypothetical protein